MRAAVTFETLSPEEYARVPLDGRVDYLHRLLDDIARKMTEARRDLEEAQREVKPANVMRMRLFTSSSQVETQKIAMSSEAMTISKPSWRG